MMFLLFVSFYFSEIAFDHTTQKQNSSPAAPQGIQISLVIGVSVGSFILVASVTSLIIFKIYRRHTQKGIQALISAKHIMIYLYFVIIWTTFIH